MKVANTLNEKARQKRHKREKATIDHLVGKVYEHEPAGGHVQNPTTDSGLPVEGQICKEWDPKKGGLPTF
jgi:hypothetical protein